MSRLLCSLVFGAVIASAQTVTGSAAYRERIAMPPNAVFEATLEDVSRADAPADILGRTTIPNAGNPPYKFSIAYDPAKIQANRTYTVRTRVSANGQLMFISDGVPVLTRGKGRDAGDILMRRATSTQSKAGQSKERQAPLGVLPATFAGTLPCADCPGIRYELNLYPDQSFILRNTYLERSVTPLDSIGRWQIQQNKLVLFPNSGSGDSFAIVSGDTLRKLDTSGNEIKSNLNYDLKRAGALAAIEPKIQTRGMFRYMADAANFQDCATGRRFPVAMEAQFPTIERAYASLKVNGQPVLADVEGQLAFRDRPDSRDKQLTLVVQKFDGFFPRESCGASFTAASLKETYWKLTRLGDSSVTVAANQKEPHIILHTADNRVTGSGGCNSLTGAFELKGVNLTFGRTASTMMACVNGMETEQALHKALGQTRRYKITGQHLDLLDEAGKSVARFESVALK